MDNSSRKIEYFLRNYFLNYSVRKQAIHVHDLEETTKYYTCKISTDKKDLTLKILKTKQLEKAKRYKLVQLHSENSFSLVCYYQIGHIEASHVIFISSDNVYVVSYDIDDEDTTIRIYIAVNIIDEVFHHLSLLEESERERRNQKIQPYCFENEERIINQPLVDYWYSFFSEILNSLFEIYSPQCSIQRKLSSFNICLTHDVDTITKNSLTQLRYLTFQFLNFARNRDFKALKKIYKYVSHHSDFNQILSIISLEKSKECASTFFLASKIERDRFGEKLVSFLIDPWYDVSDSGLFKEIFHGVHNQGFRIGLHSSFLTARNGKLLQKEWDILRDLTRGDIVANRSHFLNFLPGNTPLLLEKAGIRCDASVYYNNICGFLRHKTCSPFYLYSHVENRILDVVEIPTVIMDSTLFNYKRYTEEQAYRESTMILEKVKDQNGIVCINWHNETFAPEYGWYSIYPDLLDWIKESGGHTYTISEVYARLLFEDESNTVMTSQ